MQVKKVDKLNRLIFSALKDVDNITIEWKLDFSGNGTLSVFKKEIGKLIVINKDSFQKENIEEFIREIKDLFK